MIPLLSQCFPPFRLGIPELLYCQEHEGAQNYWNKLDYCLI